MSIPTRFIEAKEYTEIMRRTAGLNGHAGEMPNLLISSAYSEPEIREDGPYSQIIRMYVQFADLQEPVIYRDKALNSAIVLLSDYADVNYAFLSEMHAVKNAWAYLLSFAVFDMDDDDDFQNTEFSWYFRNDSVKIPEFALEDWRTH